MAGLALHNKDFVHLHTHNEYSFQDGYGSADAYCEVAKTMGFLALGLTNHGGVEGLIKHQHAAKEAGIRSILGSEMYIVPDCLVKEKGEKRYHVILLVKNFTGWKNLMKLTTEANMTGFYYKPRIDSGMLLEHIEGLVVLTGCISTFINMPGGEEFLFELGEVTEVYLEMMPVGTLEQKKLNKKLIDISGRTGLPLVLTNDCHYIEKKHNILQEVLLAMQSKKTWDDPKRWKFDIDDLYLKSAQEMFDSVNRMKIASESTILSSMENTLLVADLCKFKVKQIEVKLPQVECEKYSHLDDDNKLIELTLDGFEYRSQQHKHIADKYDEYSERLEEELILITNLNFSRYFLVVWDIIRWCKDNDIMCGPGRGSVGGSLVAYCLELTMVDPILLGLMFARFISPARIDLPDIDMDFEDIKRDQVRKHLEDIYGKYNVIGLSTFGKMHGRSAVRDVSRVFNVPLQDVSKATKSIVVRSGGDYRTSYTIQDAFDTFEDGKDFKKKYPRVSNIAIALEGTIVRTGKHAAAMCVSDSDLRTGVNAALVLRKKEIMCCWDKYDAEFMGIMKLDSLGLNALTVLSETRKLVKLRHGVDIDYEQIPLDDHKVFELISSGRTKGVFQFSGENASRIVREIGVEDFEELTALNALNRPGCLRGGLTKDYRSYKWKEKPQPKQHPIIEKITKGTRSIVLYQEQVMQILCDLAGFPWRTSDMVRKVISKSKGEEQFLKFKQEFIDGCVRLGTVGEKKAGDIFEELKHFGCLVGGTTIHRASSNQYKGCEATIEEIYNTPQLMQKIKRQGISILHLDEDDLRIRPSKMIAIVYKGVQKVFSVVTSSGKENICTARHKFPTPDGVKPLSDLIVGDELWCIAESVKRVKGKAGWINAAARFKGKKYEGEGFQKGADNVAFKDGRSKILENTKKIVFERARGKCEKCGMTKRPEHRYEFAHIKIVGEGGSYIDYHSPKNVLYLCNSCHKFFDYASGVRKKKWSKGKPSQLEKIVSIIPLDKPVKVYDISMEGPYYNFIANGVSTCNSYGFNKSHAAEYSLIAYWDAWLKVYYPLEFMCSLLSYGPDEPKKTEHFNEAKRLGIKVLLPDINISDAKIWKVDSDNNLRIPFLEIKGIGTITANHIVKVREEGGPFINFEDLLSRVDRRKCNVRIQGILQSVGMFDDHSHVIEDEGTLHAISELFPFNLSNDPMYLMRPMVDMIKQYSSIELFRIKNLFEKTVGWEREGARHYFGYMSQVKYGYRDRIQRIKGGDDKVSELGGVYGYINDGAGDCMLVFGNNMYKKKKEQVEHCVDKWMLVKAIKPPDRGSLFCDYEVWFEEDLISGNLSGLNMQCAKKVRLKKGAERDLFERIKSCEACKLRMECTSPVPPTIGEFNMSIVGEAPGKDEDRQGEGFVGISGELLFTKPYSLIEYGLSKELFHVSNVCKCCPKETRNPKLIHVKACSNILDKELLMVKPFIILGLGNAAVKYFRGKEFGITALNGTTEWLDKQKCWIHWCIHPAATLYNASQVGDFRLGLRTFADKVSVLGFGL